MNGAPERGDIVWLNFDPQVGREQAGRRPALVLSPAAYNGRVGLLIVCPITNQVKGYSYEVALPDDAGASGVVLCDQAKSMDWRGREVRFIGRVSPKFVTEVGEKLRTLLPFA